MGTFSIVTFTFFLESDVRFSPQRHMLNFKCFVVEKVFWSRVLSKFLQYFPPLGSYSSAVAIATTYRQDNRRVRV
jgi:hypothetical protein